MELASQSGVEEKACPDAALEDFERFCQWVESFPKETSYVGMGGSERACPIQKYLTAQCADEGYSRFRVGHSFVRFLIDESDHSVVHMVKVPVTGWMGKFISTFDNHVGHRRANKAMVKEVIRTVRASFTVESLRAQSSAEQPT